MTSQIYKEMFENAVHIGHRRQKWNPMMKKYIYGEKDGLHIINLESTYKLLENALNYISGLVSEGKTILFISTKPQSIKLIEDLANSVNMPYVTTKWISGLLTNFSTMKSRIKYYINLKEQEASGELDKYKKNEISKFKKEITKLETSLGGVKNMNSMPDAVFIVDVVRDKVVAKEAKKLRIPVIALVDTNSDPSLVDYPIPSNDDAIKALTYMLGKIKTALMSSKSKK